MFNLPEVSEKFSEAIYDAHMRETDLLPSAYGKTFNEFYDLEDEEEVLEEAPTLTPLEQPATECSDGCVKAWGGDCISHRPLVETLVAVEETSQPKLEMPRLFLTSLSKAEKMIQGLDLSKWGYMSEHWQGKSKFYLTMHHSEGTTHYRVSKSTYEIIMDRYDRARENENRLLSVVEEVVEEEEEFGEDCLMTCPGRWGNNCAIHWRDPNGPREVYDYDELSLLMRSVAYDDDTEVEIIEAGMIGDQDLFRVNKVAIRIIRRDLPHETIITSKEILRQTKVAFCLRSRCRRRGYCKC
jgi:hypothetical protein